jgi:hypothetical protein
MAAAADDPPCGLELEQQAGRPRAAPFVVSSLIALALVAGLAGVLVEAPSPSAVPACTRRKARAWKPWRAAGPKCWPPG